jgi:prepilin-type N-terminal cleavage/methylation domain-containing protein
VTRAGRQRGFTLIEVLMAVVLLSTMALALSRTLIASQRARAASERWMQATRLAAEGIEQLRAGQPVGPSRVPGDFDRRGEVTAWNDDDRLVRLAVTVSWNDGEPHDFQLTTLVHR